MDPDLLEELTEFAAAGTAKTREWIGRHLAEDLSAEKRRKGRVRGVKVRLANGSPAVLSEVYLREHGAEVKSVDLVDVEAVRDAGD
jgi:hypothetical protein